MYFAWRVRRRLAQDALVNELKAADASLSHAQCVEMLKSWVGESWEDDRKVLDWLEREANTVTGRVEAVREEKIKATVAELVSDLPDSAKKALLSSL